MLYKFIWRIFCQAKPDMEPRIISTEIVTPSSPIPDHLKTHKLCLLDQFAPDIYYPIILFYTEIDETTVKFSDHLKKSLSKTLTYYYPFAGRVKNDYSIECDDYGVTFIEAHVADKMSKVIKQPEIDVLEKLMPLNPNEKIGTQVNLAVQVNYFDCGGVAICVCFRHIIADVTAAASFVKNWAAVASGSSDITDVIFDCASIFPPEDLITSISKRINEKHTLTECVTKMFAFDGSKIADLRKKLGNIGSDVDRPTRFEAVSALIWGALISMARESDESTAPGAIIPVNLRKRMNPPLPQQCIGNIFHAVTENWFMNKAIDYSSLARKIHECIKMVDDDYVRKVYAGGAFVDHLKKNAEEFLNSTEVNKLFGFSGWVGLPFYEIDFGWGKPTWVSTAMRLHNVAVLLNTSDGKGMEAWVGLPKNEMAKFEQDPGILTYASFNPSI